MSSSLFAAVLLLSPAWVSAQESGFKPPAQLLAQMKSAAAPSADHAALAGLIGQWKVTTTVWPGPGAPALTFDGTVTKSWALGKRFVREDLTSAGPGGDELRGLGFVGFDKGAGRYQGMYMATDRTGMVSYSGTASVGKAGVVTFTYEGIQSDPLGKAPAMKFKMVVTVDGPDRHTLTQFYFVPGMGEVRAFQMVHTRAAQAP